MKLKSMSTIMIAAAFALFTLPAEAQFQQPPQEDVPQIEVSDNELMEFVDAAMKAQEVQADYQQEMIAIVDEEGIDVETYNNIMRSQQMEQMGQQPEELDVSAEDLNRFEEAFEKIQEVEQEMEVDINNAIEDVGMEVDRFQEINMAIQQDPELQQRVQTIIQQEQMQQEPQPQPENY